MQTLIRLIVCLIGFAFWGAGITQAQPNRAKAAKVKPTARLKEAIANDDTKALKQYLDSGGDPNGKINGSTLVSIATLSDASSHLPALQMLLKRGANPNLPDDDGVFPLYRAASTYHCGEAPFLLLLKKGANVNQKTSKGNTVLIRLTSYQSKRDVPANINLMKAALAKGADVNVRNKDGWTAYDSTEKDGTAEMVFFLRRNGAKPTPVKE